MSARRIGWIVFAVAAIAQWAVVGTVVAVRETVARTGTIARFALAMFDPADAFRGRYLQLNVPLEVAAAPPGSWRAGDRVWVGLQPDDRGIARPAGLSRTRPAAGLALRAEIAYSAENTVHLRSPFERFYMNEREAPRAEALLRGRGATNAVLVARVGRGFAVPVDIEIEGRSLRDLLAAPD